MRTAPVALAYLVQGGRAGEDATVEAAIAISDLTHGDPDCADACVLWCLAIRHAVLTGELDVRRGLECLAADRRMLWSERLDEAERLRPQDFPANWVVGALQAAWSAIVGTPIPDDDPASQMFRADHLRHGLDAAVRCGQDTDTVAAIAGGLLGALHGASAVPAEWRRKLLGWPGIRVRQLEAMTTAIVRGGQPDPFDFGYECKGDLSARAVHPLDESLHLGAIGALRPLDANIDAVVSMCRVGNRDADAIPVGTEHIEVRLVDQDGADKNPNLGFVLRDTVELLRSLRAVGKTVLLHCVQARSRTPTVAALYGRQSATRAQRTCWLDWSGRCRMSGRSRRFGPSFNGRDVGSGDVAGPRPGELEPVTGHLCEPKLRGGRIEGVRCRSAHGASPLSR